MKKDGQVKHGENPVGFDRQTVGMEIRILDAARSGLVTYRRNKATAGYS